MYSKEYFLYHFFSTYTAPSNFDNLYNMYLELERRLIQVKLIHFKPVKFKHNPNIPLRKSQFEFIYGYEYDISNAGFTYIEYLQQNGLLSLSDELLLSTLKQIKNRKLQKYFMTKLFGLLVKQNQSIYTNFIESLQNFWYLLIRTNLQNGFSGKCMRIYLDEIVFDKPLFITSISFPIPYKLKHRKIYYFIQNLAEYNKQLKITDESIDIRLPFLNEKYLKTLHSCIAKGRSGIIQFDALSRLILSDTWDDMFLLYDENGLYYLANNEKVYINNPSEIPSIKDGMSYYRYLNPLNLKCRILL